MRRSARSGLGMLMLAVAFGSGYRNPPQPKSFAKPTVLIFSKTNGYHHPSIPTGIAAIIQLGKENGFAVDTTTDSTWFRPPAEPTVITTRWPGITISKAYRSFYTALGHNDATWADSLFLHHLLAGIQYAMGKK